MCLRENRNLQDMVRIQSLRKLCLKSCQIDVVTRESVPAEHSWHPVAVGAYPEALSNRCTKERSGTCITPMQRGIVGAPKKLERPLLWILGIVSEGSHGKGEEHQLEHDDGHHVERRQRLGSARLGRLLCHLEAQQLWALWA